jgi:hypothetical protein
MERSRRQHQVLKEICDRADVETLPKHILKALMHNSEDLRYREQEHDRALNLFLAACGSATDEQSYAIESFDDLARALRNTFEHDVRQLLRPSQQEIWQQLIMDTRRRRNLAKGQLRGEQIDLGVLILCLRPSLSPAEMAALQPMRSQWRTAIDARLAARAKAAHQCDGPPYSGVHALAPAEAMMTQERQLLEARRAVRDCTHHFMELVCEALPDAKARQLETAWLRAVCPALFGSDQKIMQAIERLQEADLDHATIQYWRDHLSAVASKARSEAAATILAADGFDHLYLIAIETGLPADTLAAELSLSRIAKEDCASRISSSIRDARKITPSDW